MYTSFVHTDVVLLKIQHLLFHRQQITKIGNKIYYFTFQALIAPKLDTLMSLWARVSDSGFPAQDSFEKLSNDILCVNSF